MQKLTAETINKIYTRAWNPRFTLAETAKKYRICAGYVDQIKHGVAYANITRHKKGTTPALAYPQPKPKPAMSKDQKLAVLKKGQEIAYAIDEKYWILFEEFGQEVAEQFKQRIYVTRGSIGRKMKIPEIEDLYQQSRKQH